MGDAVVSALVKDVLRRLTSAAIQEYGLLRGLENDLSALSNTFSQIQGVLHDAEMKQTKQKDVEEWLRTLKSASLEVENIFDEVSTGAMIQRLSSEIGVKQKLRTFLSSRHNRLMVKTRIAHKVKNIRKKLSAIDANRSKFRLTPNTISEDGTGNGAEFSNRESSSILNLLYGRDEEKMMMVHKICNQDIGITHDDEYVRVYAIWGMGGIGKTTLAQYVYNHETVNSHFELKFWVFVSDVFDIRRVIKSICGSQDEHLDRIQASLQNMLRGKKFFIVLDDVWIENKDRKQWDDLYNALRCGARGSTVMVTTRNNETSMMMAKVPELQDNVEVLSKDDAWSLFEMLAFAGGREKDNRKELERIGRKIVKKCKGLPLAVKTLGSLMFLKSSVSQWQLVNDTFTSELQVNGILPALQLSYNHLPPHVKRCFAYCCLFSKGYEMTKDLLIELWMANDFIPPKGDVSLYVLGEEIINCLVWRSFFQVVIKDYGNDDDDDEDEVFIMHDLMHDLAQYVMRHDCSILELGKEFRIPDEVLHLSLSFHYCQFSKQDLEKLRSVRSILVLDNYYRSNITQICSLVYLRVLYMNGIGSSTLPESICELIHLRYLNITPSFIKVIPESIVYLQNLQFLILELCHKLYKLPKGMRYMRNLQRLDINDCHELQHMPVGIKELTNLRRLSQFVVGENDGAKIGELGNLNLGWELRLSRLENVGGLRDAQSANLKDKINLMSLSLKWCGHDPQLEREVLEGLEPNLGLQKLTIMGYMGTVMSPSWLVKLRNLTTIKLEFIQNCEQLPLLGNLPNLKTIDLYGMYGLKGFHDEDTDKSRDGKLFPSLQLLQISRCTLVSLPSNFQKLRSLRLFKFKCEILLNEIQNFKNLNELYISDCKILSKRCEKEMGEDWPKISHIPNITIDGVQIQGRFQG